VNFLFHLYLSGDDPEILLGNFMGDFVKGRLGDRYPSRLRDGITLHRTIDSFAQQSQFFQASRLRLSQEYGLYRGVLVDLFYDHFLAREWHLWSKEPFADYLQRVRLVVDQRLHLLPEPMPGLVPIIFDELLPSYLEIHGIGLALGRMARRIRRPNPLAGGEQELTRHYAALQDDFRNFMPQVLDCAARFRSQVVG